MGINTLKNLEFEYRYQVREMVRKEGSTALLQTQAGRRLMRNLEAIQDLKATKKAA